MNPLNLKSRLVYGKGGPLTRQPEAVVRYANLDHPMAGRCMSCKTIATCLRSEAVTRMPKYGEAFPEPGVWNDLLSTGCPKCGARVFVMDAREFKALIEKESKS